MRYNKLNWKQELRSDLFGWLPPIFYLKIVPYYFKLVNPNRRKCNYKFSMDKNGNMVLHAGDERLYFVDHRRINRYVYENGLSRIKDIMLKKYCTDKCGIDPNDVVVEIGANIGEFTLAAAGLAKKIYAFEPDPKCIRCLELNTRRLENVEIVKYGASDKNGKICFYLSSEDADSSLIRPENYSELLEIQGLRLDTWMEQEGLEMIDFLKVEAEGAEPEVLIGLGDKIQNVRKISVDGGPEREGVTTFKEVADYLFHHNFHVYVKRYQVYAWR
jgi:FkbM family methyltransferase